MYGFFDVHFSDYSIGGIPMAASSGQNGNRKTSNGQKRTTSSNTHTRSNTSSRSNASQSTRGRKQAQPDNSIMDEIMLILVFALVIFLFLCNSFFSL